ncbi:hypothetical protein V7148_20540 [Gottfriedia acidiceleris]|uniref:hypothetical protein n=1 Tax=Gottfriedia acidiceleris TaxID=371036 RepID=UPI00300035C3
METEGEYIRVMNIDSLPPLLRENIKEHKAKILDALYRNNKARQLGFMVGLTGQVYFCSINNNSFVFVELIGSNWEAWRETYQKGKPQAVSIKVICSDPTFEYVLSKAASYFGNR